MMKKFLLKSTVFIGFLFAALVISPAAHAVPTLVQIDHLGTGNYTMGNIFEFDWSSAGNLVIEQQLVEHNGVGDGTLAGFFAANPANGSKITFDLHAHASLTNFVDGNGDVVTANFNLNADYEVTATMDGRQTATYQNVGGDHTLQFDDMISGTFQYYLDDFTPPPATTTLKSVVSTGVGFNDGNIGVVPFLVGTVDLVSGSFNGTDGEGSSFLTNTITGYDPNVIETDPQGANWWLDGTTFDTHLELLTNPLAPTVLAGGVIGDGHYFILNDDLILNADASSEFSAVPEPATMLLLGSGLLGLAGFSRRKFKK